MQPRRGRPRCKQPCCQEEGEDILYLMYVDRKMSSRKIAQILEVSSDHIVRRLHSCKIKMKNRGRPRGAGAPRRSKLWEVGDRELFETPIKELALKYNMSWSGVEYVKRYRRKKEVNKKSNA